MRKYALYIIIVCISVTASAQLEPLSNMYLWNMMAINPAYAGNQEALSVTMLHRNQWTGFEGAPNTNTVSLHTPLRNDNVALGALLYHDQAGVSTSTGILGNFAYRIPLSKGKLSFGLGGGITIMKNAWNKLVAFDPDDALITNENQTYALPNFSVGAWYSTPKLFAGLSIPMFLSHDFNEGIYRYAIINDFSAYNYFMTGGYLFDLGANWKILPSALIRYNPGDNLQVDINSYIIYREKIWAGLSFRSNKSMVGLLMYHVTRQMALAYAYDFGLGSTGNYMSGSHEIMIRYNFRYLIDVISPRLF